MPSAPPPHIQIIHSDLTTSSSTSSDSLSNLKPRTSGGRARSSSIVSIHEVGAESTEEVLDQGAYRNINSEWVNTKGAWLIHPVLILLGKVLIDSIPGMTQEASWTIVNMGYLLISYLMFHWVTGIPFDPDLHSGAYDDLTLWEQIDEGAQYTPAKKWLFCTPIALFLISTHYTHYDPWLFAINLTALVLVLVPKLPQLHRQRIHFDLTHPEDSSVPNSGLTTPIATNSPLTENPPSLLAGSASKR